MEKVGLVPLRFHELRHTAAAIMVHEGANILQVQRRLGHDDVKTTINLCAGTVLL